MRNAHDNAGQIRILFFPAGAAMKFDFQNKRVRLERGVPNILLSGSLLFVVVHPINVSATPLAYKTSNQKRRGFYPRR